MLSRLFKGSDSSGLNVRQSWTEEPTRFKNTVEFLNWFDATDSIESALNKAHADWEQRITRFPQYAEIKKVRSLEIGFGGGRLLTCAARDFETALGVDIHQAFERSHQFLADQNIHNVKLLHRDDLKELDSDSIDFVYSFIVFQHFDSFEEVEFYLAQIQRLLVPGGLAHIFFGKKEEPGIRSVQSKEFEKRACSLFVEPATFRKHCTTFGFDIKEFDDVLAKRLEEPLGPANESGQARVLLQKLSDS